jgi:hypothetical protein
VTVSMSLIHTTASVASRGRVLKALLPSTGCLVDEVSDSPAGPHCTPLTIILTRCGSSGCWVVNSTAKGPSTLDVANSCGSTAARLAVYSNRPSNVPVLRADL